MILAKKSMYACLNGNLLASIDLETTGLQAGYHEPIQIAVVPLNSDIRPLEGVRRENSEGINNPKWPKTALHQRPSRLE